MIKNIFDVFQKSVWKFPRSNDSKRSLTFNSYRYGANFFIENKYM